MVIGYCRAYQTTSCQIFSMMDNFRGNYFHGLSHVFSNALIYTYTGEHSVMADCRTILMAIQSLGAALLLMLCLSLPSRPSSSEGWRQQLTIPVSSSSIALCPLTSPLAECSCTRRIFYVFLVCLDNVFLPYFLLGQSLRSMILCHAVRVVDIRLASLRPGVNAADHLQPVTDSVY